MRAILIASLMIVASNAGTEAKTLDLVLNGQPWASTVITPYDDASKEARASTYKVYTHIMDFAGKAPITKGLGGLYPHHRGMFIGWRETTVGAKQYDTWHMTNCYQQYVETLDEPHKVANTNSASHLLSIEWRDSETDTAFIREKRLIRACPGPDGKRIFDFDSVLTAIDNDIKLRGDSHHAGMQIRLSDEVSKHQDATDYLLPEGAKRLENDEVSGAPWVVCHVEIGGKPYWVMHMTPPPSKDDEDRFSSGQVKLYSIRPYARYGAFFEPDIPKDHTRSFMVRVVVSEKPIDLAEAKLLYEEYGRKYSRATGY